MVVCPASNEIHAESVPITLQYRNTQISSDKFNCNLSFVAFKGLEHVFLTNQKLPVSPAQKHAIFRGEKGALTWLIWMFRSNTLSYPSNSSWVGWCVDFHRLVLIPKKMQHWWGCFQQPNKFLGKYFSLLTLTWTFLFGTFPLCHISGSWKYFSDQILSFHHHEQWHHTDNGGIHKN